EIALDATLRARVEARLLGALTSTDERIASAAAAAIVWADAPRFREVVARAAALVGTEGRGDTVALARAARAAGCTTEACRALRASGVESDLDVLDQAGAREALLEPELGFPRSVVRSYALLVAARRGELGAEAVPALCAMATRREPSVRANAGLALAALGARCEGLEPSSWIARARSVSVELAGARWCSIETSPPLCDARVLSSAVARCLETASDPALHDACEALAHHRLPDLDTSTAPIDLTVVGDRERPEARRLVTLRFRDGSAITLPTDGAGRIALRIDHAAAADGTSEIVVDDPYATVLER
ncbi:MAG: hypothetical protein K1X94_25595, partial [Sandaracinaceae bacterium]|nr:hypothetical protein [Sandaracinaceae bacterium]